MERYKINRIGILNYWLYDEEEFYFYDGKLLLRGTNGSGKSVTMVSFFPLLFDGNKNPERFDTFGSRDRKVEDYVLPSTFEGNENTSYLYMEFYNKETNKYLTIGIGLRAIRNRHVEFYGFAITDNRRIKQDFMLYKDHLRKIPLTKRELQTQIGTGGYFVTSTKEYKNMINNLLFGFENESLYTELINLMLQLRSPKLSKDYKPTKLVEILSGVLEPLSETDIATMSETIENMNKYKEKINDLTLENNAIKGLLHSFKDYGDMILYNKATNYRQTLKTYEETKRKKNDLVNQLAALENQIKEEENRADKIKLELNEVEYKINTLDAKDLNRLLEEKANFETEVETRLEKITNKEQAIELKNTKRIEFENKRKELDDKIYNQEKEWTSNFQDLIDLKAELYYEEITFYLDELKELKENFNFKFLLEDLTKEKEQLKNLLKYVEEIEMLKTKKDIEEERIAQYEKETSMVEIQKKERTAILLQTIESLKKQIGSMRSNQIFYLSEDLETKILNILDNLSEDANYQIMTLLKERYLELVNNINQEILVLNQKIEVEKDNIISLKNDKEKINNILESNLEFSETKAYLNQNNIKAKYLYEVIEFKKEIPENTRKIIEKSLKRSGILETFLFKTTAVGTDLKGFINLTKVKDSLLKYFNIIDREYEKEAQQVLEAISTTSGPIKVDEEGCYELGIISGQVNADYELKYIGEQTRKSYIDELINQVDNLILNHENIIKELNDKIAESKTDLLLLEKEYQINLNLDDYHEALFALKDLELKIEMINNNIKSVLEKINVFDKEIQKIEAILETEKKHYKGPLNKQELNEVITNFDKAKEISLALKNTAIGLKNSLEIKETYHQNVEEILNSVDEILSEINLLNFEVEDLKRKIKQTEIKISSDKYLNIKTELEELNKKRKLLEEESKSNLIDNTTHKKELEIFKEDLVDIEKNENTIENLIKVTKQVFNDEYNLKYSNYEEPLEDFPKWFKNFKVSKVLTPTEASVKFLESMNNYLPKLQNYAGRKTSILNYDEYIETNNTEEITKILNDAKRIDMEFRYSGKTLNLLDLNKAISLELETTISLLNEEDRKLFEDLLMNNIGDSIRRRIASSNEWIKEVKRLMETMNTSSGLTFSIKWLGKGRETEEELDTKEIVDIFERDPQTLKEEDLQKITNHFRSKITLEEEKYEESERNYLEIIRNVLDYRKWYEFKLYFKRAESDKKELTDKEFSKFSGGEKAIAMYIPLFAGIYAKFNSARNDAPRIIALDEAFAGVDDDNILDCFRIMNEMDLDYILTSQILWGDYSSVKHLAICELHHLPSSNVVSIIRYKWDGIKRSLVTNELEYQN